MPRSGFFLAFAPQMTGGNGTIPVPAGRKCYETVRSDVLPGVVR